MISISLLGITAYFLYQYIFPSTNTVQGVVTIDDLLPRTVNVPKISTNLGNSSIVVIEMTLLASNQKAKQEADKRMFQIKDRINLYLKNLTIESFSTEEKINQFKTNLIKRLNNLLQDGKIEGIDITQLILQ